MSVTKYRAVTTGVKVKDTIKKKDNNNFVDKTLNREQLVAIQTPQAFSRDLILQAHQQVPRQTRVSDDASLVELFGQPVKIIKGAYDNIKITTPVDMMLARQIIQKRSGN